MQVKWFPIFLLTLTELSAASVEKRILRFLYHQQEHS